MEMNSTLNESYENKNKQFEEMKMKTLKEIQGKTKKQLKEILTFNLSIFKAEEKELPWVWSQ